MSIRPFLACADPMRSEERVDFDVPRLFDDNHGDPLVHIVQTMQLVTDAWSIRDIRREGKGSEGPTDLQHQQGKDEDGNPHHNQPGLSPNG